MNLRLARTTEQDCFGWDAFALSHAHGSPYHLFGWNRVIKATYGHDLMFLIAGKDASTPRKARTDEIALQSAVVEKVSNRGSDVRGILPMVHISHRLFGNSLTSMPYCDSGGVLAVDTAVEQLLVEYSIRLAQEHHVQWVEFRQYHPLTCLEHEGFAGPPSLSGQRKLRSVSGWSVSAAAESKKIHMLVELPESPDALMQSFKAKLRSQIRKPMKQGLTTRIGGADLIDDFYDVLAANMRDLGSPVHSKQLVLEILLNFPERVRIFIVYGNGVPMACSLTLGFNGILSNPWASSLRRYSQFAPNMLLYWAMLEYACQRGYRKFDFGRSTVDEGTYRFKEQWGARPEPLYWYRFARDCHSVKGMTTKKDWMTQAMGCWKRLPVPVTRVLGPRIRRYISL